MLNDELWRYDCALMDEQFLDQAAPSIRVRLLSGEPNLQPRPVAHVDITVPVDVGTGAP